jgi:hypothetical protein
MRLFAYSIMEWLIFLGGACALLLLLGASRRLLFAKRFRGCLRCGCELKNGKGACLMCGQSLRHLPPWLNELFHADSVDQSESKAGIGLSV